MSAEERRKQLLDIAQRIIDAEGFPAATPKRIADEAGINRTVIYQQFGDPAGMFAALVDREITRAGVQFAQVVAEVPDVGRTGDRYLVRVFEGTLNAIDAHPATWRLFLFPPEGAPAELHRRLASSQDFLLSFLTRELLRMRPDLHDPEYTARMVQAAGRELLQLRLSDPESATRERLSALMRSLNADITGRSGEKALSERGE